MISGRVSPGNVGTSSLGDAASVRLGDVTPDVAEAFAEAAISASTCLQHTRLHNDCVPVLIDHLRVRVRLSLWQRKRQWGRVLPCTLSDSFQHAVILGQVCTRQVVCASRHCQAVD
eukprot:scpid10515/ scgid10856/ 